MAEAESQPVSRPSGANARVNHGGSDSDISDSDGGFANRVRGALAWRWGSQVAMQIITWTSTILVVRLLAPEDYGLFAMSQVVVTALAFLNGQSFATSLVQTDRVDERRVG
ncbi:oligosaccharide flippase family protein, partial [Lutimonas sp.]|uniref:oligosaccharide flippase family protein n=1 Tax=Lutimonas sp. TaxID=1872403 RepID=UPI003C747FE9